MLVAVMSFVRLRMMNNVRAGRPVPERIIAEKIELQEEVQFGFGTAHRHPEFAEGLDVGPSAALGLARSKKEVVDIAGQLPKVSSIKCSLYCSHLLCPVYSSHILCPVYSSKDAQ